MYHEAVWDDENAFPILCFTFDQQYTVPTLTQETTQHYDINKTTNLKPSGVTKIVNFHQKHVNTKTGKEYNYTKIIFIGNDEAKKQVSTLKNLFNRVSKDAKPEPKKEVVLEQMESYSQEMNKRQGWRGRNQEGQEEHNEKVDEVMVQEELKAGEAIVGVRMWRDGETLIPIWLQFIIEKRE